MPGALTAPHLADSLKESHIEPLNGFDFPRREDDACEPLKRLYGLPRDCRGAHAPGRPAQRQAPEDRKHPLPCDWNRRLVKFGRGLPGDTPDLLQMLTKCRAVRSRIVQTHR